MSSRVTRSAMRAIVAKNNADSKVNIDAKRVTRSMTSKSVTNQYIDSDSDSVSDSDVEPDFDSKYVLYPEPREFVPETAVVSRYGLIFMTDEELEEFYVREPNRRVCVKDHEEMTYPCQIEVEGKQMLKNDPIAVSLYAGFDDDFSTLIQCDGVDDPWTLWDEDPTAPVGKKWVVAPKGYIWEENCESSYFNDMEYHSLVKVT